jgi:transcriptional regulator with XRE-family HTH domain
VSAASVRTTLGDRILRLREAHGLTQQQLGAAVGLTRSSIANTEAGRQNLPIDTITRLAETLHTSISVLVGETDPLLPPKVTAVREGWIIHCEACGLVGPAPTGESAERARQGHLTVHLRKLGLLPDNHG